MDRATDQIMDRITEKRFSGPAESCSGDHFIEDCRGVLASMDEVNRARGRFHFLTQLLFLLLINIISFATFSLFKEN